MTTRTTRTKAPSSKKNNTEHNMLIILFCFARESKMPLITMSDYNNKINVYIYNT